MSCDPDINDYIITVADLENQNKTLRRKSDDLMMICDYQTKMLDTMRERLDDAEDRAKYYFKLSKGLHTDIGHDSDGVKAGTSD